MKKSVFILFVFLFPRFLISSDSLWVNYGPILNYMSLHVTAIDRNQNKWIGTYNNGMYKYNGNTWVLFDTSNCGLPWNNIEALAVDSNNVLWIGTWAGGNMSKGVVKYDGINWIIYNTTNSGLCSNAINYISVERNNAVWICTVNGLSKYYNNTWTTFNILDNWITGVAIKDSIKWVASTGGIARFDGVIWNFYTYANSGLPSDIVFGIAMDSAGCVWCATEFGGVAKFNYQTNQWTVYNEGNSGLSCNNTSAIAIDKDGTVWIGTCSLMNKFYDGQWLYFHTANSGLPSTTIDKIVIDQYNNKWFTTDAGLAAFYPHGIIGIKNNETVFADYQLHQNYPNPFNPVTKIRYALPKDGKVTLRIYDITGRLIRTLVDEIKLSGNYTLDFNGSELSSGIYFYQLISGDFTMTKKMVLVK